MTNYYNDLEADVPVSSSASGGPITSQSRQSISNAGSTSSLPSRRSLRSALAHLNRSAGQVAGVLPGRRAPITVRLVQRASGRSVAPVRQPTATVSVSKRNMNRLPPRSCTVADHRGRPSAAGGVPSMSKPA